MNIIKKCTSCRNDVSIPVTKEEYFNYTIGNYYYIQDCFPHMSADYREMFISGICPTCWDKIFGKEE